MLVLGLVDEVLGEPKVEEGNVLHTDENIAQARFIVPAAFLLSKRWNNVDSPVSQAFRQIFLAHVRGRVHAGKYPEVGVLFYHSSCKVFKVS